MFLSTVLNLRQHLLSNSGLHYGQGWMCLEESCSARTGINIHIATTAHFAFWVTNCVMLKQRGFFSFSKSHAYKPAISVTQTIIQSYLSTLEEGNLSHNTPVQYMAMVISLLTPAAISLCPQACDLIIFVIILATNVISSHKIVH